MRVNKPLIIPWEAEPVLSNEADRLKRFYFQAKGYRISVFFYTNRDMSPGCGQDELKKITISYD
jgi:hypothetical protein